MTKIEFKSLIDQHFTSKMLKNGWHGTYNSLRKTDAQHTVKTFGVTKYIDKHLFLATIGLDFNIYSKYAIKKTISLSKSNCLFTNALTPTSITDDAYEWELSQDHDQNVHLIASMWQAMNLHGQAFYANFENFPQPFDTITPSEFENDKKVKLLGKYDVSNQVGFMHLLKNVNLMIGKEQVAKQFSEIAISKLYKAIESQPRALSKNIKKDIKKWIKALEI